MRSACKRARASPRAAAGLFRHSEGGPPCANADRRVSECTGRTSSAALHAPCGWLAGPSSRPYTEATGGIPRVSKGRLASFDAPLRHDSPSHFEPCLQNRPPGTPPAAPPYAGVRNGAFVTRASLARTLPRICAICIARHSSSFLRSRGARAFSVGLKSAMKRVVKRAASKGGLFASRRPLLAHPSPASRSVPLATDNASLSGGARGPDRVRHTGGEFALAPMCAASCRPRLCPVSSFPWHLLIACFRRLSKGRSPSRWCMPCLFRHEEQCPSQLRTPPWRPRRQSVTRVDFRFCLNWHANEWDRNNSELMPNNDQDLSALRALLHRLLSLGRYPQRSRSSLCRYLAGPSDTPTLRKRRRLGPRFGWVMWSIDRPFNSGSRHIAHHDEMRALRARTEGGDHRLLGRACCLAHGLSGHAHHSEFPANAPAQWRGPLVVDHHKGLPGRGGRGRELLNSGAGATCTIQRVAPYQFGPEPERQ